MIQKIIPWSEKIKIIIEDFDWERAQDAIDLVTHKYESIKELKKRGQLLLEEVISKNLQEITTECLSAIKQDDFISLRCIVTESYIDNQSAAEELAYQAEQNEPRK